MIVRTRIFDFCDGQYKNLTELAHAMEISVSQVYRVREGKRTINQKFIIGAMKAFPEHKLDDLFYLTSSTPTSSISNSNVIRKEMVPEHHQHTIERVGAAN